MKLEYNVYGIILYLNSSDQCFDFFNMLDVGYREYQSKQEYHYLGT